MHNPFPPTSLADFTISDPISKMHIESIVNGKLPFPMQKNCICLCGTYGTGKTTLAELLPSLLEASGNLLPFTRLHNLFGSPNYWHVTSCGQGSNGTSIMQAIDGRQKTDVYLSPNGYFYEILDEVDLLTLSAQESLKSKISFAKSTIYILTTNHRTKLDGGLVDRSFMIEMNQASAADMAVMGRRFLRQMGLVGNELSDSYLMNLAAASRGSIRDFGFSMAVEGLRHGGVLR